MNTSPIKRLMSRLLSDTSDDQDAAHQLVEHSSPELTLPSSLTIPRSEADHHNTLNIAMPKLEQPQSKSIYSPTPLPNDRHPRSISVHRKPDVDSD